MSDSDRREEIRRQTHAALQRIRGLDPAEPPVEPVAQTAWLLETNGGRRHPLDVVISGALHPVLKVRGFERKGRTWNRRVNGLVHVINVQASKYNVLTQRSPCLFYVNIGVFIPAVQELVDREPGDGFVPEYRCHVRHRLDVLMGDRSLMIMSLEPDRTLEQQGEQVTRWILEAGVSYLDQFISLETLYPIILDEADRGIHDVSKWALAYSGAKTGDIARAENVLQAMVRGMGNNITWREKLERVASALNLPIAFPAPKPMPTPHGFREGTEILANVQLDEVGADWHRTSLEVGASAWPRQEKTFQRRSGTEAWQLDCELIHFADAAMAEEELPVSTLVPDAFEMIEDLGDSPARRFVLPLGNTQALTYAFRVGAVRCVVRLAGWSLGYDGVRRALHPDGAESEARRVAQLQETRLRLQLTEAAADLPILTLTPPEPNSGMSIASPLITVYRKASAWRLELADCAGLRDSDDVQRTFERLCELGLAPSLGPWDWQGGKPQPVEDVRAWMDHVHHESDVWKRWKDTGRRLARANGTEHWHGAAIRPGLNWPSVMFSIGRYGRDNWHLTVWAAQRDHAKAGVPLEDYAASWAELLVRITEDLRPILNPKLSILYASDSYVESVEDEERGALLLGWRTWYAPSLVERFGCEFLLGLPDETELLDDGSIAHKLAVSPAEMVLPTRGKYARLRPYLDGRGIELGWPRL
jgi:hypothetical protein